MKKTLLSVIFLCSLVAGVIAQVPQGFNYQAIALDATGHPLDKATINVRLSILSDTLGFKASGAGTYVWEEEHLSVTTNSYGLFTVVLGTGTRIQGSATAFNLINWVGTPLYIGSKIANGGSYKILGSAKMWSVPYAMTSSGLSSGSKLSVVSANDAGTSALFEVKRKDGQTVFAVYPDAVNVYVPNGLKGAKGGFAVGGFDQAKGYSQEYLRVTPDSVRVYIDNTPAKGSKGGFAVGGFDNAKGGILPNYFMNVTGATQFDVVKGTPQILWYPNKNAFLGGNVWIGSKDSVGDYSTALGYRSISMGDYSQAFGYKAKAFGDYSTSIGKWSVAGARSGAGHGTSTASNAFAFGNTAKALGADSYAFGSGAEATGLRSFAFGSVGIDTLGNPTSTKTRATGAYSTALGMGAQSTSTGSMALGVSTTSSGLASTTLGFGGTAIGNFSTAIGFRAKASTIYSTAVGYYAVVYGDYGHSFGYRANAYGASSLALGYKAQSTGQFAVAMGYNPVASNTSSIAIGVNAQSTGQNAVAMGYSPLASNTYAVAIGYYAKATTTNAYSFGYYSEAAGDNSFAIGTYGLNGDGTTNTARPTKTFLSYSVALGMGAQSTKKGALSFGVNPTASGDYSTAIGYGPTSSGTYSTAIGVNTSSAGSYASAIGYTATSAGSYSLSLGMGAQSDGSYSTAVGYYSKALGNKSLAIGSQYSYTYLRLRINKFTGEIEWYPVTVNKYNTATRDFSLAIGNGNTAEDGGAAIGSNNSALSLGSVALGHSNVADTSYAVAIGYGNTSNAFHAFAMGENLVAQSSNSFVVGSFNTPTGNKFTWVETDPIFVVGNGDATNGTHDAMRVLKNGGTYLYPENAYAGLSISNYNTSTSPYTYMYGLMSYIQRNKVGGVYYSGYFYDDNGTNGTYNGVYADVRTGASIDVAEYINDSNGNTQPADVVVADQNRKESIIKSSQPYQTGVLGVISTNPHLTMGFEIVADEKTGEFKKGVQAARLALTGRVPVNVTGENGDIKPGDYLTTSSTPGFAMKWTLLDVNAATDFNDLKRILAENERRRNAIIGKAVESFTGPGNGKIMVLISLQ